MSGIAEPGPPVLEGEASVPFTPAQTAVEQIARDLGLIRKLLRRPLEAEIAKGNLTGPQQAVMRIVVREQGIPLKALSAQAGLAQSTVSGIVDRLEQRGLIERRADPKDGRSAQIHPTAVVIDFLKETMPRLQSDPLLRALERASAQEIAGIACAVARLRELIEERGIEDRLNTQAGNENARRNRSEAAAHPR